MYMYVCIILCMYIIQTNEWYSAMIIIYLLLFISFRRYLKRENRHSSHTKHTTFHPNEFLKGISPSYNRCRRHHCCLFSPPSKEHTPPTCIDNPIINIIDQKENLKKSRRPIQNDKRKKAKRHTHTHSCRAKKTKKTICKSPQKRISHHPSIYQSIILAKRLSQKRQREIFQLLVSTMT